MGSGSTAVAAVRTERHYVGFDTDPEYVALAERRIHEERHATPVAIRRVTVVPGRAAGSADAVGGQAVALGRKDRDIAEQALAAAGFTDIEHGAGFTDLGVAADYRARDARGATWLFLLSGAYSATRPGLRRADVLWRALGVAAVLHEARTADPGRTDLGPLVLLSTDLPAPRSAGAKSTWERSPPLFRYGWRTDDSTGVWSLRRWAERTGCGVRRPVCTAADRGRTGLQSGPRRGLALTCGRLAAAQTWPVFMAWSRHTARDTQAAVVMAVESLG